MQIKIRIKNINKYVLRGTSVKIRDPGRESKLVHQHETSRTLLVKQNVRFGGTILERNFRCSCIPLRPSMPQRLLTKELQTAVKLEYKRK